MMKIFSILSQAIFKITCTNNPTSEIRIAPFPIGSPVICQVYLLSMYLKSVCKKSIHTRKSMYQKSIRPKGNVLKVKVPKKSVSSKLNFLFGKIIKSLYDRVCIFLMVSYCTYLLIKHELVNQ